MKKKKNKNNQSQNSEKLTKSELKNAFRLDSIKTDKFNKGSIIRK